jgi:hypothetical protein
MPENHGQNERGRGQKSFRFTAKTDVRPFGVAEGANSVKSPEKSDIFSKKHLTLAL